jgi:hypothetical protein
MKLMSGAAFDGCQSDIGIDMALPVFRRAYEVFKRANTAILNEHAQNR